MEENPEPVGEISSNGDGESLLSVFENKGCQIVFGVLLVLALIWMAVLYIGIPVALVGGTVATYYYRSAAVRFDDDVAIRKMRDGAILLAIGSAVLAATSVAGNYFSNDAPFYSFLHGGKPEGFNPTNEGE